MRYKLIGTNNTDNVIKTILNNRGIEDWEEYINLCCASRDSYINLNGLWEYKITYKKDIPSEYDGNILVPFPLESRLSKVQKELKRNQYLFYKKEFSLPADFKKDKVILHFQAVDQIATVYVNGHEVAYHENGYLPFEAEIQDYLQEVNTIIVKVKDNLDPKYPFDMVLT